MTTKKTPKKGKKIEISKPTMIVCGKHLINIQDVRMITQVRKNLYIVKFFSDPNPQYPCWVTSQHIGALLKCFNVVVTEDPEEDLEDSPEEESIRWDR